MSVQTKTSIWISCQSQLFWHQERLSLNDYFTSLRHWIKVDFESSLIIDEEVMLDNSVISAQTLLDTDAEINLILQYFIIEHQLFSIKRELSQPQFLNRQKVYCFKAYWVKYCLINNWRQLQDCKHTFYSLNKKKSALLLELSALITENVQIDCRTKTWHFNIEEQSIEI